ncbi:sulfotransferase family 2 domain-containing protein [Roseomonas sp. AR75]|uniref:sulfotransferase family 2 domain-containing protein n=1 Tax=Roseomonas sp. AR75 TaxID=2562311 RepID=UPI00148504FC|nr:sulfotransferase family 2 domain-containing protein [Roseomonas sp. AR75]
MRLLFEGSFNAYFRAAAPGQGLVLFVHVPKTAGTSLRREIAALRQPDVNIVVDYADTARSFHERMDQSVERFLARAAEKPVRFASGHIFARHVARIRAAMPDTRVVTFLRDPVSRVVSDFRYQGSERHPLHAEFRARVPDLDAYLALESERNKMAEHLVPREIRADGDPAACVAHLLGTYDFIGVQELYPLGFRTLTTMLGAPAWPTLRENVGATEEAEQGVSPDMAARIRAANPLDVALYQAVAPRWQRLREALAKRLA